METQQDIPNQEPTQPAQSQVEITNHSQNIEIVENESKVREPSRLTRIEDNLKRLQNYCQQQDQLIGAITTTNTIFEEEIKLRLQICEIQIDEFKTEQQNAIMEQKAIIIMQSKQLDEQKQIFQSYKLQMESKITDMESKYDKILEMINQKEDKNIDNQNI
eukprot:403368116